ncbi:MAG: tRNA lysidine(34) synthetase TilS [Verrucomicrobiales bacterium]|nr:tRNA lysidine(34) synthetase TilS [Verrucomicrobiales bacterium]
MSEFLQRVESEIQNRRLLLRGQKILVAISGGADSMVLLHALDSFAHKFRWKISVAHFNHQLRGRSSDADEKLVRKTAAALKLPVFVERADVKSFAKKSKLSIEMAARKLRHEFFARVARERKIYTIALAHHADDQVELFFVRLLRGAGGEGLAGMKWRSPSPADKTITLVRPLLGLTKAEMLDFASENKIPFREDETNASSDFLRNRVRNELIPLLQKKYQPGLAKSVLRLMEIIGAESEAVGKLAEDWRKRRWPGFENLPVAVQRRVLQSQLVSLGLMADFELVESLRQTAGFTISVSRDISVLRNTSGKVSLKRFQPTEFNPDELAVDLAGRAGEVFFDGACVNWSIDEQKKFKRPPGKAAREFFDAVKIGRKITLRHWRAGDRFQPIGLKSPAKLQDLLTNAKIPRERRHNLIVAATAGGEIFWVEGLRISENFKLTPGTKRRLVWRWRRR